MKGRRERRGDIGLTNNNAANGQNRSNRRRAASVNFNVGAPLVGALPEGVGKRRPYFFGESNACCRLRKKAS